MLGLAGWDMQPCCPTFRYSEADMGSSASCRAAVVRAEHRLWSPSRFSGAVSCSMELMVIRHKLRQAQAYQDPSLLFAGAWQEGGRQSHAHRLAPCHSLKNGLMADVCVTLLSLQI